MPATISATPTHGLVQASAAQAIAFPTVQRVLAVNAVEDYLRMLRAWTQTRLAIAGNGAGVVAVGNRNSYIYARLGSTGGEVIEAKLINLLDPQDGDTLLVRRDNPGGPGGWLVIDWFGGDVPIRACDVGALIFYILRGNDIFRTNSLSAGGGSADERNAWDLIAGARLAAFITPTQSNKVVLAVSDGLDQAQLQYSADGAQSWSLVESVSFEQTFAPSKTKPDYSNRALVWYPSFSYLVQADQDALNVIFDGLDGFYSTAYVEIFLGTQFGDYVPLRVHVSTNGGATFTAITVDYLANLYPLTVMGTIADGGSFTSSTPGAVPDCGSMLGKIASYLNTGDGNVGIYVCGGNEWRDAPTWFGVEIATLTIAPAHDGTHAYIVIGLQYISYITVTSAIYHPVYGYDNRIYRVASDGSFSEISDVFAIGTDFYSATDTDYIFVAEASPLDDDLLYALTMVSKTLLKITWSSLTVTILTFPWDAADQVVDLVVTNLGTLIAPVATVGANLYVYRSDDDGVTWNTIDLTAHIGPYPTDLYPYVGVDENHVLALATTAGKVLFSTDDGVTWDASADILGEGVINETDG